MFNNFKEGQKIMNRTCMRSGHCGGYYYIRTTKLMQLFIYWTCKVILFDAF